MISKGVSVHVWPFANTKHWLILLTFWVKFHSSPSYFQLCKLISKPIRKHELSVDSQATEAIHNEKCIVMKLFGLLLRLTMDKVKR